jgi:ribosomal protein S18 acetylase RimI-like enzyme
LRRQKPAILEQEGNLVLRPLRESDIPSIITIDERTSGRAKPEYWRSKLTRYLLQSPAGPDAEDGVLARVAEMEGEVVGFMIGEIRRWEFGQPFCGWITALGTDPNYQRLGIGRRLLAELLDYYRDKELREIRTIVEWSDGDLLKFFHSMGFVRGPFVELQKSL